MKQNMKKLWIVLCMVVCLFALSGCSKADDSADEIDAQVVSAMEQYADYYLNLFTSLSKDEVVAEINACEKNKNYTMMSAFQSWESVMDDMGDYIAHNPAVVETTDDGYIARVDAVFNQRDMEFSIMINEDGTEILGISFAPEYTMGEKMAKAGMNTLMGMGVVFAVLIFIAWVISLFKYISVFENKMKAKNAPAPKAAPAPAAAPAPVAAPVVEEVEYVDDTELIAVITAAIAASEGKTAAEALNNGLVVRSIKRVPNRSWK